MQTPVYRACAHAGSNPFGIQLETCGSLIGQGRCHLHHFFATQLRAWRPSLAERCTGLDVAAQTSSHKLYRSKPSGDAPQAFARQQG